MANEKIKTYGLELVLVGVVIFVAIIFLTIGAYKIFIKSQLQKSLEYKTATYFVVNSQTLQDNLLSPMTSMVFDEVRVIERGDYGICEITFDLQLENGLTEDLQVGLVKVSDFWIVYEAILSPDTPSQYAIVSTYQKILLLLERLDFQDIKTAQAFLTLIKKEIRDVNLAEYLTARVNAMAGNDVYARQVLEDLVLRVSYAKIAVLYEQAMVAFTQNHFKVAKNVFLEVVDVIEKQQKDEDVLLKQRSLFRGLPRDPFIISFSSDHILAESYLNLSLTYHQLEDYEPGLKYASLAIDQAEKITSDVIKSSAMFVKALNLYALKRYEDADDAFIAVINDLGNTNLTQKSWSYYYRAVIAALFGRQQDSLDYYETAVGLDPFNSVIRKGVINYLMDRNFVGDLEVALGFSLRGMAYEIESSMFKDLASVIYSRLGMQDKTKGME